MKTSREYRNMCPYHDSCDSNKCCPWGFTHTESPDVNGKRLLIVGLNANDFLLDAWNPSRDEYSFYLKELIRVEIERNKYKCLSNLMQPIARYLYGSGSTDSQLAALQHLNWTNLISCCPSQKRPQSKPTKMMIALCKRRLEEDGNHELVNRISLISPTNILLVGADAREIWEKVDLSGTVLNGALNKITPRPIVCFSKHPSQRNISRLAYWEEVYIALTSQSIQS